jgi:PAS domain S-box-containing protein
MKSSDFPATSALGLLTPNAENFSHLLEVSAEAVIVVHRTSGRLLAVNTAACKLYGFPRSTLQQMRYPDLATETKSVVTIFNERREHVPLRYHRRADGLHFPVEMNLRWAGSGDEEYAFIAVRDVSEHFRRERQEKDEGQRYQTLFRAAPYPLFLLNNRGIIVEANTAALERYRCELAEMIDQHISTFLGDAQQAARYYLSRQSVLNAEWHRRRDGEMFLADILLTRQQDANGQTTLVAVRDITEERALLDRLKASEERWRFALEGQGDGLWDWNLDSNELSVSDDFREAIGMPPGTGQENLAAWQERISPDEAKPLSQAFSALLRGTTPLLEHQLRVRCRNGDYHWLEMRGKVMEWSLKGRALRIVGSIRDIEEERRKAEIEQSRQEQMLHTARLVSVGEIASALAHEVNQPLTAICNFSAVALHKLKAGAPEHELTSLMQTIAEQAMRAGSITHQIRSFVKKGKTSLRPLSLQLLVAGILPLASMQAKTFEANLDIAIDAELPEVLADQVQIEQLLLNLIRNGFESMQQSTAPRQLILCARQEADARVRIEVIDHGHGLSAAMIDGHWEPFYSNKEDGLGMGLSICRSIIENHSGHLWAEPAPEGGAKFCFTLACAQEGAHAE